MIIESKEKGNKRYYNEIMYISSNYYIFKKNPRTKVHALTNIYIFDIILFSILFIVFILIPQINYLSPIFFTMIFIYGYLLVEAKYRMRDHLKYGNCIIKITEDGIENIFSDKTSVKLPWDAIEYIIFNKYSICILPKNFSAILIGIEISSKAEVYKALKKYEKINLLIDNSDKYK